MNFSCFGLIGHRKEGQREERTLETIDALSISFRKNHVKTSLTFSSAKQRNTIFIQMS